MLFNSIASARSLTRRLHVASVKTISKTKKYNVTFKEMAAFYSSKEDTIKCLASSAKNNESVLVKWDMETLEIQKCKK